MFNLLVKGLPWDSHRDSIPASRVLNYTDAEILTSYAPGGSPRYDLLRDLPSLFVEETDRSSAHQYARVGRIIDVQVRGSDVYLEYLLDQSVPPIPQATLTSMANALGIQMPRRGFTELETTHWAVKKADLYKQLLAATVAATRVPAVFEVPAIQHVDENQVSAMMPFAPTFNAVYAAITGAAADNGMVCNRADDVWDHDAIIQDIVALIDRSKILVCDCSGRNPNVFYEIGIAHTMGKEVILITQHLDDVPFDLRHLRVITYLNNGEGCERLRESLSKRMSDLTSRVTR